MTTAVYRDPLFLEHDPGPGHPENRRRLLAVLESLDRDPIPGTRVEHGRPARREELLRVHDSAYLERIERTAGHRHVRLDPDTVTSAASWDAALLAAGSVVDAVEQTARGSSRNAFALVRPPGHHAEARQAMGFCLLNNVAVAAAHAIEEGGLRRVLVLDPDVHHGNGTQHAFWRRREVLYVSSHRYPFFPGTGALDERGEGDGRGTTLNLPLPAGTGDADLVLLYERVVGPVVERFDPELILVSAGFDTWRNDPLGGFAVTERGFAALFALFRRWADRHCPGRLVLTLEGGYDPRGLTLGVRAALGALAASAPPEGRVEGAPSDAARRVADAHGVRL